MAIFLFFTGFFIYLYTLYPTVPAFRDAGDLITSAYTLGIAHPPGYPVYIILGKIWAFLIPFGNIGYRMNLFSAFTSALCVVVVYWLAKKLFNDTWPAIISTLFLIFSNSFWEQSIVGEIYSLNALFAVLIVYLLLLPTSSPQANLLGRLPLTAFLFGVGLGNHQTLVLLLPGIVYMLVKRSEQKWEEVNKSNFPSLTSFHFISLSFTTFLLGFSIYLFLPVRAARQPINNWGNPRSFGNFVNVLLRSDYGVIKLSQRHSGTAGKLADSAKMCWKLQKKQLGWPGLILLTIGIILSFRDVPGKLLLLLSIFTGPFFIFLSRLPNNEFSIAMLDPACTLSSVFTVLMIGIVIKSMPKKPLIFIFLFISLYAGFINFLELNKRYNFLAYDYAKNLVRSVPKNSFLSMTADIPIFTINYFQEVEKKRQDIKVVLHSYMPWRIAEYEKKYPELFPLGKFGSTTDHLIKILSLSEPPRRTGQESKYQVFAEGVHAELEEYSVPAGIICKITTNKDISSRAKMIKEKLYLYNLYPFRKPLGQLPYYEKQLIYYYTSSCYNAGVIFAQAGWQNEANAAFNRKLMFEQ